jgi:hypothetical protein
MDMQMHKQILFLHLINVNFMMAANSFYRRQAVHMQLLNEVCKEV